MDFTLSQYIKFSGAEIIKYSEKRYDKLSVCTDTRKITANDIYLPLRGEKFDGHDFIEQALKNGAKGYFTSDKNKYFDDAEFILYVENTLVAYLKIAQEYKRLINPKTIAITGSSGKTTTKEMVASVCSQHYKTHKTLLNHNNEIGLAQTILSMPADTEVLIVEMGMRGLGEIELLAKYSQPDIGIITNIGTAHLGRLKSVENIAKAKCELIKYLSPEGLLIVEDTPKVKPYIDDFCGKVKTVSIDKFVENGDLSIETHSVGSSKFIYKGVEYKLNTEGEHNILNAIYAIEVGLNFDIPCKKIAKGLEFYKSVGNRWKVETINGYSVINDSYNANPESVKCAVKTFLECYAKPHVLVLGDMAELGENSPFYHKQIGKLLNEYEPEILITVGELAKNIAELSCWNCVSFSATEDVANYIKNNISKKSVILLKASRIMELEKIEEGLKE